MKALDYPDLEARAIERAREKMTDNGQSWIIPVLEASGLLDAIRAVLELPSAYGLKGLRPPGWTLDKADGYEYALALVRATIEEAME